MGSDKDQNSRLFSRKFLDRLKGGGGHREGDGDRADEQRARKEPETLPGLEDPPAPPDRGAPSRDDPLPSPRRQAPFSPPDDARPPPRAEGAPRPLLDLSPQEPPPKDSPPPGPLIRKPEAKVTARPEPGRPSTITSLPPREPRNLDEAGVSFTLIEQIVMRLLLNTGTSSGRQVSRVLCLAKEVTDNLLDKLRHQRLCQHSGTTPTGDFLWSLTDKGRSRALELRRQSLYVGPAPVTFPQYLEAVSLQTVTDIQPGPDDLERAFTDLVVNPTVSAQIGPALTSGRGLFLYGNAGNGKTSIAERITYAFGGTIWIPQVLLVDGVIINLYDPTAHERVKESDAGLPPNRRYDRRWIPIRRPTVVAGGELVLEMLDIKYNETTNVCEAPLQLKANCGSLVIDDFGRQQVEPERLLNRWTVPMERRVDFLRMPNARKLQVPFDVLLIFSTNLEPWQLVDEAFLRRIPNKILIPDPTEKEFRILLERCQGELGLSVEDPHLWDWLVDHRYRKHERPFRFCHPRDLLQQVVNICRYERRPPLVTRELLERSAHMYFAS